MQTSGRVSFVCRGADNSPSGHKLDECPDYELATRHLLALVTQTATNEVAVVDLYAQSIIDIDQTTPGYSFLRVGAKPGAIVTTPGGAATFVGVSGLEKDGIFALPTTCVPAAATGRSSTRFDDLVGLPSELRPRRHQRGLGSRAGRQRAARDLPGSNGPACVAENRRRLPG